MSSSTAYRATADAARAAALAQTTSPYAIELRFLGGLTEAQQAAFTAAADRWTRVIVGDLPSVVVDGEAIDDILILAQGREIDGPGRVLGRAGPTHLRPSSDGVTGLLPAKGIMSFDTADLERMESDGTLGDVITHEMGHVLGIGTVWTHKGMLQGANTDDPTFSGPGAISEYQTLRGSEERRNLPVENTGGAGTRNSHWRETIFGDELMSGFITAAGNPLSRVTAASLGDIGYQVDLAAAEPYQLPNLLQPAEDGMLAVRRAPIVGGVVLPVVPFVLPGDSLDV